MSRQIYLEYNKDGCVKAAVRDSGVLTELYDIDRSSGLIGNIYAARVSEYNESLDACFIELGTGRNSVKGYLKSGAYKKGDFVLVRLERPGTDRKVCMCTDKVSIPSDCLILLLNDPGARVHISRKITDPERRARLTAVANGLMSECTIPQVSGLIIRTMAAEADDSAIRRSFEGLTEKAADILAKFEGCRKNGNPARLFKTNPLYAVANAFAASTVSDVYYNTPGAREEFSSIIGSISGNYHLVNSATLACFGIDREYSSVSGHSVKLPSGGNIVIDTVEAATVIDVNSASGSAKKPNPNLILDTNLEAAAEIMRQLRLRNIGGIVLIDFINMKTREEEAAVLKVLKEKALLDPSQVNIEGFTRLKIMELTRKRLS